MFCYRSGSKSLDGARLEKPKFAVAPTCDRPLSQQGKIFLHFVENYSTYPSFREVFFFKTL
jgi:hypothetical protein